jgi:DNA-binding MarR family transcriptional regulator
MTQKRGTASPRYQALLLLLETADRVWNASRLFFARWNLSPSQFNVLNLLFTAAEGRSQIELGRLLLMHRSNVTGLVDRLEKRGLVERLDVAGDRRVFRVVLTVKGRRLLEEVYPHYFAASERAWKGVADARIQETSAALRQVAINANQAIDAGGTDDTSPRMESTD